MKKLMFWLVGATALCGCSSVYMKASPFYSGSDSVYKVPVEQRVNLWPLVYSRDPALSVIWPLYTQGADCWYAWPLLTWCEENSWGSLPLLSGHSRRRISYKNDRGERTMRLIDRDFFLAGFGGVKWVNGNYDSSWLFPLFHHDSHRFTSLLYAQDQGWAFIPPLLSFKERDKGVDRYRVMLLSGVDIGNGGYRGSYLFPLFCDNEKHFLSWLFYRNYSTGDYISLTTGRCGGYSWWLTPLVSSYEKKDKRMFWAWPLFGWYENKTEEGLWWLGGIPLWNREKLKSGYAESILWRAWHKEERNGSVTLDCFPGITYDSHPDGYEKTSFLWRFYRNEVIPGKGRNLDVFFIPFSSAAE